MNKEDILYRLARLVRNTDGIHVTSWAKQCGKLLLDLRNLDEDRYQQEVMNPAKKETPESVEINGVKFVPEESTKTVLANQSDIIKGLLLHYYGVVKSDRQVKEMIEDEDLRVMVGFGCDGPSLKEILEDILSIHTGEESPSDDVSNYWTIRHTPAEC